MSEEMTLQAVFTAQDRAAQNNEASSEVTKKQIAFVSAQDYDAVARETQSGRMRNRTYGAAITNLGELGKRIDDLHGRLSNLGAHVTATRLKFASYEWDGVSYDRVGAALDPKSAELAVFWASDACLHLSESLERAYSQEGIDYPAAARLARLRQMFRLG